MNSKKVKKLGRDPKTPLEEILLVVESNNEIVSEIHTMVEGIVEYVQDFDRDLDRISEICEEWKKESKARKAFCLEGVVHKE